MTHEEINSFLHYSPTTGVFTWKTDVARNVKAGRVAGCIQSHGYIYIALKKKRYAAHRLAWFMTFGEWPKKHIDHINGDKTDNRITNIREANASENGQNRKPNKNNKTGIKGVTRHNKKFRAEINHQGENFYLGVFDNPEDAAKAYAKAAKKLHTHNNAKG